MLHEMGIETGIDLPALIDASRAAQDVARPSAREPCAVGGPGRVALTLTADAGADAVRDVRDRADPGATAVLACGPGQ